MKKALIILWSVAGALGIIAFFVVFYSGSGSYVVTSNGPAGGNPNASTTGILALPTTTASSTATTSSVAGGAPSTTIGEAPQFSSDYGSPVITWNEGHETMGITGASLAGNELTLNIQIAMGTDAECVPLNIRYVADESGTLAPPVTPGFVFPESGSCEGAAGATYNDQAITFTVNQAAFPVFFTTGGTSNVYFQVATTTGGGVSVSIPSTNG